MVILLLYSEDCHLYFFESTYFYLIEFLKKNILFSHQFLKMFNHMTSEVIEEILNPWHILSTSAINLPIWHKLQQLREKKQKGHL